MALLVGVSGCGGNEPADRARLKTGAKGIVTHPCETEIWAHGGERIPVGIRVEVLRDEDRPAIMAKQCETGPAASVEYDLRLVRVLVLDGDRKGQQISVPRFTIHPE
jgi:hypothetical protein